MLQVAHPFRKESFGGISYNRFNTRGGYMYLNETAYGIIDIIDSNELFIHDFNEQLDIRNHIENLIKRGVLYESPIKKRMQITSKSNELSQDRLSSPTSVDIYPAFHCNYRCGFCYVGNWVENPGKVILTEEAIDKLVNSIYASGVFHVGILGGEPLLYKHIGKLFDSLNQANVHISLATNATNYDESIIESLIKYNIDVNISVQGHSEEIHNSIVKSSNSFAKANTFIKILKKANKPFLLSTVVNLKNYLYIEEYIDWCASVGATDVTLFFPERSKYAVCNSMDFNFADFILTLKKAKERGKIFGLKVDSNCHFDFLIQENLTDFNASNPLSSYLYGDKAFNSRLDIMPNGDAYPNYEFFGLPDFKLGNALESNIYQLWNNNSFDKMHRLSSRLPNACSQCEFKSICKGGHMSRALKSNTFIESPDYCPLIDEALTFKKINTMYYS